MSQDRGTEEESGMAMQDIVYKIEVRGARGILPMDPNGQSDPYCKIGLADAQTNEFIDPNNVKRSKVSILMFYSIPNLINLLSLLFRHTT